MPHGGTPGFAVQALTRTRGADNGTELTSTAILESCQERKIEWNNIAPGKPQQKAFAERFIGCTAASEAPRETSASTRRSLAAGPRPRPCSPNGATTIIEQGPIRACELAGASDFVVGDATEHVREPGLGIDNVEFSRVDWGGGSPAGSLST